MTMQTQANIRLRLAQELRARDIQAAANARLLVRSPRPAPRRSIRRAIGTRIIAIGIRLATDPSPTPARTR
jgi:hypothetical protein